MEAATMIRAEVKINPDEIRMLIVQHYGLPIEAIQKVRAIYKIKTPNGSFGFKNAEELPDLPFVADYLNQIRQNGFERMPGILLTSQGKHLVFHHDEAYFMEEWFDYEELPKESLPFLGDVGRSLADFHHSAKGLIPSSESNRFEWGKRKAFLLTDYHKLRTWRQRHLNTPMENQILDFLFSRCYMALEYIKYVSPNLLLKACPDAAVLCHGGLHHKNILIDHHNKIWFIDFETMVYTERVMDLAQLLQYHAGSYNWNPVVVNTFLTAYIAQLKMPLCPEEWNILLSYLAFPRRFHNRMIRYFDNIERPQEFLIKLKETMDQDSAKDHLLSLFKAGVPPKNQSVCESAKSL
jgi:CotS family spore coat protein